jgi:hypothetical protein
MIKYKIRKKLHNAWVVSFALLFLAPLVIKSTHFHHHPSEAPPIHSVIEGFHEHCAICNYELNQLTDIVQDCLQCADVFYVKTQTERIDGQILPQPVGCIRLRAPPSHCFN